MDPLKADFVEVFCGCCLLTFGGLYTWLLVFDGLLLMVFVDFLDFDGF